MAEGDATGAEFLGGLFFELVQRERGAAARDERRAEVALDRLLRDHALGDVLAGRQLEHDVEEGELDDRAHDLMAC